jgi:hypothetical protein
MTDTPKQDKYASIRPFLQVAEALNHPQCPTKERIRAEHQAKINKLDKVYE